MGFAYGLDRRVYRGVDLPNTHKNGHSPEILVERLMVSLAFGGSKRSRIREKSLLRALIPLGFKGSGFITNRPLYYASKDPPPPN